MLDREIKVWGERWVVRRDTTHDSSILRVNKGYRCSWHRHAAKWNLFCVIAGRVGIKTEEGEMVLTAGETANVAPGVWHEFRAYEDSIIFEEAFVVYNEGDIDRKNAGGKL